MNLTHLLALVKSLALVSSMVLTPFALHNFLPSSALRKDQFVTRSVRHEAYLLQSHRM